MVDCKEAGRSGTRSALAELAFCLLFLIMQKSKSLSRLERQNQTYYTKLSVKESI